MQEWPKPPSRQPAQRETYYVDFLRALSLVVVVIWHWGFTILEVTPTTVSPNSPIGTTFGMWAITWVLQVMPVFFFVGGYTHRLAFDDYEKGASRRFLKKAGDAPAAPCVGIDCDVGRNRFHHRGHHRPGVDLVRSDPGAFTPVVPDRLPGPGGPGSACYSGPLEMGRAGDYLAGRSGRGV